MYPDFTVVLIDILFVVSWLIFSAAGYEKGYDYLFSVANEYGIVDCCFQFKYFNS